MELFAGPIYHSVVEVATGMRQVLSILIALHSSAILNQEHLPFATVMTPPI